MAKSNYLTKTLVERPDVCFASLTEDKFVELMGHDINLAENMYKELNNDENMSLSYLDVDITYQYDSNLIDRTISINEKLEENIRKAYKSIIQSPNFEKGRGWRIEYEYNSNFGFRSSFRPCIKILFDKEFTDMLLEKRRLQALEISRFYDDLKYKGD